MIKNMKVISLKIIILFFILTKYIFANDINSVEIISDELEWNEKEKIAYARGNASAEQKDKKIMADELIVHLSKDNKNIKNNNEIVMIEAIGNVIFSSKEDKDERSSNPIEEKSKFEIPLDVSASTQRSFSNKSNFATPRNGLKIFI